MAHEQTEESQGKLHYRYYHKIQQSLNRQIKNAKGEAQKEKIKMKEGLEQAYKKPKGDYEKLKSVYEYNEKHSKWSPSSKSKDSIELVNKVTKALEEGETEARRKNRIQELELKLRDRQNVPNRDDIDELKKLKTEAKSKKGRKDEDGK